MSAGRQRNARRAAAGFTLQVAEPHLNGPGGDAPIIIHDAMAGTQHVICGQGVAPDAATPEKFAALGLDRRPALMLGIRELRLFNRVAIDFSTRKVLFDLPKDL